jgi:hypothetical protein
MKFEVLAGKMSPKIIWITTPHSFVDGHHFGRMLRATYKTTWHQNPEVHN